jgi:methylmalonyl-CoA mutase
MLRTTIACFASAVGGADSITLLPFDAVLGVSDTFGRRIARNTQLVLREESSLHRVLDPAGGAWALESIADSLADKAWTAFQEIEAAGGMATVLGDGTLAARIQAKWRVRARRLAHREEPVTGVSDFPDLMEQPVRTVPVDPDGLRAAAAERLARHRADHDVDALVDTVRRDADLQGGGLLRAVDDAAAAGATVAALSQGLSSGEATAIAPFPRHRLGEAFENLREKCDAWAARTGRQPCVYLAVMGDLAAYSARAAYAQNALAAAGIEAVSGPGGLDADATAAAFRSSKTAVSVLCSTDAVYASHAAEWAKALRAAGARKLLLVGAAAADVASEIDASMHVGCDMLGLLSDILEEIGVLSE